MSNLKFDRDLFEMSYNYDNEKIVFTNKYTGYSYDILDIKHNEYCSYKKFCENLRGDIDHNELARLYGIDVDKIPRGIITPNPQLGFLDYIVRGSESAIDPIIECDNFVFFNILLLAISLFGLSYCAYKVTYYYLSSYSAFNIIFRYGVCLLLLLVAFVLREFYIGRLDVKEDKTDIDSNKKTWVNIIPAIVLANVSGIAFFIDYILMIIFKYRIVTTKLINDLGIAGLLSLVFYACLIPYLFHFDLSESIMKIFGLKNDDYCKGFIRVVCKPAVLTLPVFIIIMLFKKKFGFDLFIHKYFWEYRVVIVILLIATVFKIWPMEKEIKVKRFFTISYLVAMLFHVVNFVLLFINKDPLSSIPLKIGYECSAQEVSLLLIVVIGTVIFNCNSLPMTRYKSIDE